MTKIMVKIANKFMDLKNNPAGYKNAAKILRSRGVGIIPTDTLYGIVGQALDKGVAAKIYRLRKRNLKKPLIILIASLRGLAKFNVKLDIFSKTVLKKVWPGKVSVILACRSKKFAYLHRGTKSLAFRLTKDKSLIKLLKITGPLVAPSANLEGKKPATTIAEAKKYFGNNVNFYLNAGQIRKAPSKLIKIVNKQIKILR